MADNREVTYNIIERIAVLADGNDGWHKEVNLVSWNGGPAKIDIRDWSPDHERMTRGITLPEEAASEITERHDLINRGAENSTEPRG